jgi:hypothetical protein
MKNALLCLLLSLVTVTVLAASPQPSPVPSPTQATMTVPRGIIVPVLVTKDIRIGGFGNSTEEKKVEFMVAQDVIVDGHLVLKTGDLVEGHYTNERNETKRVFSTDVSQELALDVDDAVNYCGDTIHLQFERTYVGGGRIGIGSLGAHAHDAVFQEGIVLKAKTDRLQRDVCADVTTEQPPILDNMVVPDEEVSPGP